MYWRAWNSARAINCWISSLRSRSSLERTKQSSSDKTRRVTHFWGSWLRRLICIMISLRSMFSSSRIFICTCKDSLFAFSSEYRCSKSLLYETNNSQHDLFPLMMCYLYSGSEFFHSTGRIHMDDLRSRIDRTAASSGLTRLSSVYFRRGVLSSIWMRRRRSSSSSRSRVLSDWESRWDSNENDQHRSLEKQLIGSSIFDGLLFEKNLSIVVLCFLN